MSARTLFPGLALVAAALAGRSCPWCGASNATPEHINNCGGRFAAERATTFAPGDCPFCGHEPGGPWCCGLSTSRAYADAVIASAPVDIYIGVGTVRVETRAHERRLPHALKGGVR